MPAVGGGTPTSQPPASALGPGPAVGTRVAWEGLADGAAQRQWSSNARSLWFLREARNSEILFLI